MAGASSAVPSLRFLLPMRPEHVTIELNTSMILFPGESNGYQILGQKSWIFPGKTILHLQRQINKELMKATFCCSLETRAKG